MISTITGNFIWKPINSLATLIRGDEYDTLHFYPYPANLELSPKWRRYLAIPFELMGLLVVIFLVAPFEVMGL